MGSDQGSTIIIPTSSQGYHPCSPQGYILGVFLPFVWLFTYLLVLRIRPSQGRTPPLSSISQRDRHSVSWYVFSEQISFYLSDDVTAKVVLSDPHRSQSLRLGLTGPPPMLNTPLILRPMDTISVQPSTEDFEGSFK